MPAQIGDLDRIHVGNNDFAFFPAPQPDHRKNLEILAAQRTGTDQEKFLVQNFGLEFGAENGDLGIISRIFLFFIFIFLFLNFDIDIANMDLVE